MSETTEVQIITQTVDTRITAAGIEVSLNNLPATGMIFGIPGPQGSPGPEGPVGAPGADGQDGAGIPAGGTARQIPVKQNETDYQLTWSARSVIDPVTGQAGFGTLTPDVNAKQEINAVGDGVSGLKVLVDVNEAVFDFREPDNSDLMNAHLKTGEFRWNLYKKLTYRLQGNQFVFNGGGLTSSQVRLQDGVSLRGDPNADGSSYMMEVSLSSYATQSIQLTTTNLYSIRTWAWNGTNGYSIKTVTKLGQVQQSALQGDARFFVKNHANEEAISVDLRNKRLGIGVNTPTAALHTYGAIRPGSCTVATVPDPASAGAGAMIFVSDETGGAIMAFSDGANWRRMSDRTVIS
jgi:hypothetical protein